MGSSQHYRFHKLSTVQPNSSTLETLQKLKKLQNLVQQSKVAAANIRQVIKALDKVAAQAGQPFLFSKCLEINERLVRNTLARCDDVKYRTFRAGQAKALLVYINGLTDTNKLETNVIDCLMLVIDSAKYEKRQISKAENEDASKGPHDSFNETLSDNIALVRRRTKDSDLKVEILEIGARTKTSVALLYIDDLVKPGLVDEVRNQLLAIRIDMVILAANIEEFLTNQVWNPFPNVLATERPDKTVAGLYDGRLSIIIDNSPSVLILPVSLQDFMQSVDDYTTRPSVASLIRFSRYISAFLAIFLPALYICVVAYHPGMIPSGLSFFIAELRAKTPFPASIEALLMEALLEIFQEAIIRLPQKLSAAAGVVGALVIGTTVVEAALANALLVVVVATTGLASFCMPSYTFATALRVFRIPALVAAATLGLYGVAIFFVVMIVYLCSLHSYGESYLGDLFDITLLEDWKDGLLRFPAKFLKSRPKRLGTIDKTRKGDTSGKS
ncbi:MAG: GerA spore germination protein [Firmicutes bacterium]|nr:GerA spore germination protein [Bacillota bacterium]